MEKEIQPLVYPTDEITFGITKDGTVIDNLNKEKNPERTAIFFTTLQQYFENLDITNPIVMANLVMYLIHDMAIKPTIKHKIDSIKNVGQ